MNLDPVVSPVQGEAVEGQSVQWTTGDGDHTRHRAEWIVNWVLANGGEARYVPNGENTSQGWSGYPRIAVRTANGWAYAKPGDYMVMGTATFCVHGDDHDGFCRREFTVCGWRTVGDVDHAEPTASTSEGEAVETDPDVAVDEAYDAWDAVLHNRECHRVQWTLEPGRVRGRIICEGRPDDAGCRYYCPEGCEVYPCEHPPTLGKTCGVEPWFDDGAECYYDGPEVSAHDGPVELIWDGDGYSWRYAEARRPVAGSPVHEGEPVRAVCSGGGPSRELGKVLIEFQVDEGTVRQLGSEWLLTPLADRSSS